MTEKSITKNNTEALALDSKELFDKSTDISPILRDVVEKQKLYVPIQGKKYVTVEGWTTLGMLIGVYPEVDFVKKAELCEKGEIKYKARVSLKTRNGEIITSAEAICSNQEASRGKNEEYVIYSMAQTRATGKAFRLAFSWIMKMAGYEGVGAEEMPKEDK